MINIIYEVSGSRAVCYEFFLLDFAKILLIVNRRYFSVIDVLENLLSNDKVFIDSRKAENYGKIYCNNCRIIIALICMF